MCEEFMEEHLNSNFENIVDILCNTTGNYDKAYARVVAMWGCALPITCMRMAIQTLDKGNIPMNVFAMCFAQSGYGKTYTVNTMESLLKDFNSQFKKVMVASASANITKLSRRFSTLNGTTQNEEVERWEKTYHSLGPYPMVFDSGTSPAVKQLHQKLQIANSGSINLTMDEVGANLVANEDLFNALIELFDAGLIKQKLTKVTTESKRIDDITGSVPTNCLLFGNPSKVFDGGTTEQAIYSMLKMGYYRRSDMAYGQSQKQVRTDLTAEELYKKRVDPLTKQEKQDWQNRFAILADGSLLNFLVEEPESIGILRTEYQLFCERRALQYNEYEEDKKVELQNRWSRAIRKAGILCILDWLTDTSTKQLVITKEHLLQGIYYTEACEDAFFRVLTKEPVYAKTVKYLSSINTSNEDEYKTHSELADIIPGYKTMATWIKTNNQMAKSWGLTHGYLVTTKLDGDIEFLGAKLLNKTNLDKIKLSISTNLGTGYKNVILPFSGEGSSIAKLVQSSATGVEGDTTPLHWVNHHLNNGNRRDDAVVQGFNCIVLDCDGDCTINTMKALLEDVSYILHTTKRNGLDGKERFRVIIPINYELKLDNYSYKELMKNILNLFPFKIDDAVCQRSHKWTTTPNSTVIINEPVDDDNNHKLFDILPYIPHSKQCDERESRLKDNKSIKDFNKLELWIYQAIVDGEGTGERNKNIFKYGMALKDNNESIEGIIRHINHLNDSLPDPLGEEEIKQIINSICNR